jgi:hypothetical protein
MMVSAPSYWLELLAHPAPQPMTTTDQTDVTLVELIEADDSDNDVNANNKHNGMSFIDKAREIRLAEERRSAFRRLRKTW